MYSSPEDKRAYDRAYRQANREKINARRRAKYSADPATRERARNSAKRVYEKSGREYHRQYRAANGDRIRKRRRAWTYGLTVESIDALSEAQGHRCALCHVHADDAPQGHLVIDHSHEDGRVRGMLCHRCNMELGVIESRRNELSKLLDYADNAKADATIRALQEIVKADRE